MKKTAYIILSALLIALLLCSCSGDPAKVSEDDNLIKSIDTSSLSSDENYDYREAGASVPNSYTAFQKSALNFSFELLKSISETGGTVAAPANAYLQMALMANGASKAAKTEILSAFGGEITAGNLNNCIQYFQTRLSCFNDKSENNAFFVYMKNSLWCNDTFDIGKDFLKTDAFCYNADIYRLLFSESNALAKLNNWVKDNSGNDRDALDFLEDGDLMYLAGAISAKDNWLEDYTESNITRDTFYSPGANIRTAYYASSEYYLKSDTAKGFIKSFKNTPLKLCVIVPDEEVSMEDYLKNLTGEAFLTMLNNMDPTVRCNAYLPNFYKSETADITAALKDMGINTIFTEEAKMGNMTKTEGVHLSKVLQAVDFEISENGLSTSDIQEKTAANSVLDNEATVKADRPFIFAVIDNESNIPLYLGIVENI